MNSSFLEFVVGTSTHSLGTHIVAEGVSYAAWAPERSMMEITIHAASLGSARKLVLEKNKDGYFTGIDPEGRAGDRYTFCVDGHEGLPDLASRYQPEGLNGPSMVIDPRAYSWKAKGWKRPVWQGHVLYELHLGTFTQEGTFSAAIQHLDYLADLGVTAVELLPVIQCTGTRNWGYDGVLLFAPYHVYGKPDEMRAFIDECHLRGLAVILDVVYNHIGAIGDSTDFYSRFISHSKNNGAWGKSFNLHGENSRPVRHLLLQNIDYWLDEFRIDGFRLDATHAIHDESEKHLLVQASELIHAHDAFVTAEDDRNTAEILKPLEDGGWHLDAVWSDDFHHAVRVSQTKENHSYLGRYTGSFEEIADTLRHGWYFRGQTHPKLHKPKGTPCDHLPPERFIDCISNHDQVGNRPFGERLHQTISPESYRAISLFFCLIPYTPMLFMGQEWAASSPFLYFTDHPGHFGELVAEGRKREFKFDAHKPGCTLPDCQAEATFHNSKLRWNELLHSPHRDVLSLYRAGLKLRRDFFGERNPGRECWKVEADSNRLSLTYQWPQRVLEVTLGLPLNGKNATMARGETLLRSNDPRFGGQIVDEGLEAVVTLHSRT